MKEGNLIPDNGYMPAFAEYAQGWWEWETCAYLKKRRKRYSLTQTYANNNRKNLNNQPLKYFGTMPLNKITWDDVEAWFDKLIEEDYRNTTINGLYGTLKTMLIEAVARKLIDKDPTDKMRRLVNDRREIKIITPREFKKLFVVDWKKVWDNDRISYTANKLAALTGMRAREVLGLKGGFVYDDHIYLCKQLCDIWAKIFRKVLTKKSKKYILNEPWKNPEYLQPVFQVSIRFIFKKRRKRLILKRMLMPLFVG
jgi:integrase